MPAASARPIQIDAGAAGTVGGLIDAPARAQAAFVLAHGAGAGMHHPFMAAIAQGLALRGIAALRFQFPYMERGSRRCDTPAVAEGTIRAAVQEAARVTPGVPLFAGGKSFGGRMTSLAQASEPLPGVAGLAFVGFPLHPAGRPDDARGRHLANVDIPMLFLQGTRDELADLALLRPVVGKLGPRATLLLFEDADHSFRTRARAPRNTAEVLADLIEAMAGWMTSVASSAPPRPRSTA